MSWATLFSEDSEDSLELLQYVFYPVIEKLNDSDRVALSCVDRRTRTLVLQHNGWWSSGYPIRPRAADFFNSDARLSWALANGFVNNCEDAARMGQLKILQWARGQDPPRPWDARSCAYAAKRGDLEMLSWLRAQHPPCRLEVLKWLRLQDPPCPWNGETTASAVENLEILQWARTQDPPCPWDESLFVHAINMRLFNLEGLRWAREQDPPCPWSTNIFTRAVQLEDWWILDWLRHQDSPCPWDEWTSLAAASLVSGYDGRDGSSLLMLQWLREQPPCPWNVDDILERAASNGSHDVLAWIQELEWHQLQ